jgi:hypothetical protein
MALPSLYLFLQLLFQLLRQFGALGSNADSALSYLELQLFTNVDGGLSHTLPIAFLLAVAVIFYSTSEKSSDSRQSPGSHEAKGKRGDSISNNDRHANNGVEERLADDDDAAYVYIGNSNDKNSQGNGNDDEQPSIEFADENKRSRSARFFLIKSMVFVCLSASGIVTISFLTLPFYLAACVYITIDVFFSESSVSLFWYRSGLWSMIYYSLVYVTLEYLYQLDFFFVALPSSSMAARVIGLYKLKNLDSSSISAAVTLAFVLALFSLLCELLILESKEVYSSSSPSMGLSAAAAVDEAAAELPSSPLVNPADGGEEEKGYSGSNRYRSHAVLKSGKLIKVYFVRSTWINVSE